MKRTSVRTKLMIAILFAILLIIGGLYNQKAREVEAAWDSYNIGGIDDAKYPGYKSQIQEMQRQYPNWSFKVLYTGIDWNNAINGEYTGHGGSPKSLIQNTYNGEWVCPICGYKTYDVHHNWYCASKEAIGYMMDPRNSLTADWVFQFQNLGSSAGTESEIRQMVNGTFLNNQECINAIIKAAKDYNISPFHLISRILQEQGTAGMGNMNGYIYNGKVVYNLFNIKVSGNSEAGFLAGAQYADEQGWYTRAASINGGAKFLRDNYLNGGQTTLYFQKYNVVNHNNLYQNQYMQNIRAANDEGNKIYQAYNKSKILNSHFEFIIPIYENMPTTPCAKPLKDGDKYTGDITSQITQFNVAKNASNAEYITGNIIIVEWRNGKSTVPRTLPKMTLESTDGSIKQEIFVKQVSGNTYYFDKYIQGLDKTKRYIIKAELTERANISNHKTMTVALANKTFANSTCYISNNVLCLGNYQGGLTHQLYDITLNQTSAGNKYISGTIMAIEWINGKSTVPSELPKMTLRATDGTKSANLFVKYDGRNDYYFDLFVDGIDTSKKYELILELTEVNNTSKDKKNTVKLTDKQLGKLNNKDMIIQANKICWQYQGDITTKLSGISLGKISNSSYYITGNIKIAENISGKEFAPMTLPKLTIESTDGKVKQAMYSKQTSAGNYYFDCYINGLDKSKEYQIYAQLTDTTNVGTKQRQMVTLPNKTLGNDGKVDILIKDNKLKYQYDGGLTSELQELKLNKTAGGKYYISGKLIAVEWVNGKSTVPQHTPKLTLVSTDGKQNLEAYVNQTGTNTYYFDRYIDNIDTTKQYKLMLQLVTSYNISKNKTNTVNITKMKSDMGTYQNYKMVISNGVITFKDQSYVGNINSELKRFSLAKSGQNSYVSGEIVVVEWINNQSTVPNKTPKMRFRSTDSKVNMEVFVTPTGTNTYYFDRFIEGIDTSKEYYFEIESANELNISPNKKMNVYFTNTKYNNTIIGKYRNKNIRLLKQKISFEDYTYVGNINSELKRFSLGKSGQNSYTSGEIVVVEWVNGKSTVPEKAPKMRFRSTDGKVNLDVFVTATGTNTYYFDRFIEGIDTSKEYYFEIESGSSENVSPNKKMNVYFKGSFEQKTLGTYHNKTVRLENNKIVFK